MDDRAKKREFKCLDGDTNIPNTPSSYAFAKAIKRSDNVIRDKKSSIESW